MPLVEVTLLTALVVAAAVQRARPAIAAGSGGAKGSEALAEIRQDLYFQVPCARPSDVLTRIIEVINPLEVAPAGAYGIYLRKCAVNHVVFGFGNGREDQFLAAVAVGREDLSCLGHFTALTWTELDGEMVAGAELSDLYDRIDNAVVSMGGGSTPSV